MISQAAVLAPTPALARFSTFRLTTTSGSEARAALDRLIAIDDARRVIGLGLDLAALLELTIPGLRAFPMFTGEAATRAPSTQGALWVALHGDGATSLHERAESTIDAVRSAFALVDETHAFTYAGGRDLTGYVDGTENPTDDRAIETAIARGERSIHGGSFVATQRWVHDLRTFRALTPADQDNIIGRARETNEELDDAPPSAHVKRSAQESFEPEAFMVRRSMPWSSEGRRGLYFVAFGASLDPFERVLKRMLGLDANGRPSVEDDVVDALYRFSKAETGSYFWCPPVDANGRLLL